MPPQQDARLWWLLAALLGCEGLPAQELQAPALLKPLLTACLAAPLPHQLTRGGAPHHPLEHSSVLWPGC